MTAPEGAASGAAVSEGAAGEGHSAAEVVRRVFGGRRRSRAEGGRPHKFTVRFTDEELDAVALKATAARVSIPHYLALRVLETPRGGGMDLGIARAALTLGAGREKKGDPLDYGAGVEMLVQVGDRVAADQPVARLYGSRQVEQATHLVRGALTVAAKPVAPRPHVLAAL